MPDAERTFRFAINDAIAETAHLTGLRAGRAVELLVDAIYKSVTRPDVVWAGREVFKKDER